MQIEKMDDVREMSRMQQREALLEKFEFRYGINAYRWDEAYSKLYIYDAGLKGFLCLASLYYNNSGEVLQILQRNAV